MAKYGISDTHFGHKNILRFDSRPFPDIVTHDKVIIENINDTLSAGDELYHLGDVAFHDDNLTRFFSMIRKDIKLILIRGNHDDKIAWKRRREFHEAHEALYVRHEGEQFYLSHYAHRVWRNSHHGSFHLYGHTHGSLESEPWGKSMDIGVNVPGIDYRPIDFMEAARRLKDRSIVDHHPTV